MHADIMHKWYSKLFLWHNHHENQHADEPIVVGRFDTCVIGGVRCLRCLFDSFVLCDSVFVVYHYSSIISSNTSTIFAQQRFVADVTVPSRHTR